MADDEENFAGDLFGSDDEVASIPDPTFETYTRENCQDDSKSVRIRLVGSHPLWAHHLWNASKVFANHFDQNPSICAGKTVLELGAGGALPSIVAALNGASKVVVTDYPDKELVDNMQYNTDINLPDSIKERVHVEGYVWGTSTASLRKALPAGKSTYDVIILSDLVFNHSQHHAMLRTCRDLLTPSTGRVYVFYTHHRPHLAHRDLEFFQIAQRPYQEDIDPDDRELVGYSFHADHFLQKKMHVMFEEDPGDIETRATVHGWQLWL